MVRLLIWLDICLIFIFGKWKFTCKCWKFLDARIIINDFVIILSMPLQRSIEAIKYALASMHYTWTTFIYCYSTVKSSVIIGYLLFFCTDNIFVFIKTILYVCVNVFMHLNEFYTIFMVNEYIFHNQTVSTETTTKKWTTHNIDNWLNLIRLGFNACNAVCCNIIIILTHSKHILVCNT